jgi:hypothetical protein
MVAVKQAGQDTQRALIFFNSKELKMHPNITVVSKLLDSALCNFRLALSFLGLLLFGISCIFSRALSRLLC